MSEHNTTELIAKLAAAEKALEKIEQCAEHNFGRQTEKLADADEHPDDRAVDQFAAAMKAKLAKKRAEGRGGWDNRDECSPEHLSYLLVQHCLKGDPLDVGNLAMMLHHRGDRIVIDEETQAIMGRPHSADERVMEALRSLLTLTKFELADNVNRQPWARAIEKAESALSGSGAGATTPSGEVEARIKRMVERFLSWKLPDDFSPDGGISFQKTYNENTQWPMKHEPVGTNLFDYKQAEAMVRHMLELTSKAALAAIRGDVK